MWVAAKDAMPMAFRAGVTMRELPSNTKKYKKKKEPDVSPMEGRTDGGIEVTVD